MSATTKIQWATHTFNPWEGCTKVSPGCTHCYAEARNHRFGNDNWGKGKPRRRTSAAYWKQPIKWNREAEGALERPRIFPSLCDWLDGEVPIEWLADFLRLIHDTPNLDWLLLTKRPENFDYRLAAARQSLKLPFEPRDEFQDFIFGWQQGNPPDNVWVGVSVEDQKRANERIPFLGEIPAKVRFLSVEPLLGPVNLVGPFDGPQAFPLGMGIQWVIVGGESGPGARPCNVAWVRRVVNECWSRQLPCFVKQLGSRPFDTEHPSNRRFQFPVPGNWDDGKFFPEFKDKKGGDPDEWPEDLRVRQFPTNSNSALTPDPSPPGEGNLRARPTL